MYCRKEMVKILICYLIPKKSYGTLSKDAIFFGQPCMISAGNTKISVSQAVSRDVRNTFINFLHNCAMKIKSHFEDVDQLIAKVKAVTIKNKTRQAKLSTIVTHLSLFLQDGEAS